MEKKVKMIYVITNTDNNQIFFEIAKRIFQKHRNIEIVRILGIGWFIDYRKDLKIINTANDSAISVSYTHLTLPTKRIV